MTPSTGIMASICAWLRDRSLSILFICLTLGSLALLGISGYFAFNQKLVTHGCPEMPFRRYLLTGDFLDAIFGNWQAAVLQLGCLILFAGILYQKGASHSKKPEKRGEKPSSSGPRPSWLYRHSLSLAFVAIFLLCLRPV